MLYNNSLSIYRKSLFKYKKDVTNNRTLVLVTSFIFMLQYLK